ncbi:MAG TPA: TPM domain-containing protein [Bacteroidales bacterium]|nr:TPM domain-containing protein [Bacteroidales bacterium]
MRIKLYILPTFLLAILTGIIQAQDFPEKSVPPRLVNDFAGMLNSNEINSLEQKLVAFNDSTSTQISIVTVPSLHGYDKADYAQRLGEKWGIGQKGKNNGILILVKPKTESEQGEVYIAQGYGLEGAIPDLHASDIINNQILPSFTAGDYYGGLDKATTTLMQLARGEFPADLYKKHQNFSSFAPFIIFIIFIVIMMFLRSGGGNNGKHIGKKGLPIWLLLSMMNSRNSHNGSWGGFGSGGSGGGGGFGGFGGGSFGGGGAGGSW